MAKQDQDSTNSTVVRRVKASGAKAARSTDTRDNSQVVNKVSPAKNKTKSSAKKTTKSQSKKPVFILFRPFIALGRYFRDSWRELRQVRWTNRRATWALTLAVILFSLFFAVFIMLFDWLFNYLIQEVIL